MSLEKKLIELQEPESCESNTNNIDQNLNKLNVECIKNQFSLHFAALKDKLPEYNFKLKYREEDGQILFFLVSGTNVLNIPIKDTEKLKYYIQSISKIMSYEGEIGLTGKKDFRRIYANNFFGKELFYLGTKFDSKNKLNIEEATYNNNIAEEIFRFIQEVKGIPKEKWLIEESIKNSGSIGFPSE